MCYIATYIPIIIRNQEDEHKKRNGIPFALLGEAWYHEIMTPFKQHNKNPSLTLIIKGDSTWKIVELEQAIKIAKQYKIGQLIFESSCLDHLRTGLVNSGCFISVNSMTINLNTNSTEQVCSHLNRHLSESIVESCLKKVSHVDKAKPVASQHPNTRTIKKLNLSFYIDRIGNVSEDTVSAYTGQNQWCETRGFLFLVMKQHKNVTNVTK
jgi:hypothetical protein